MRVSDYPAGTAGAEGHAPGDGIEVDEAVSLGGGHDPQGEPLGFAALLQLPDLETGDLATPMLLASELVPTVLGIIVMIGTLAAAVSTIDSIMLTLASMLSRDVYRVAKEDANELQQLTLGKVVLPVIALLAFGFAQLELSLIAVLSVSASAGMLVMVPAIIGAIFWKRGTATGVLVSTIVAGTVVLALEVTQTRLLDQGTGVWGLKIALVLYIGVSLATKAPEERASEFLGHVRENLRPRTTPQDARISLDRQPLESWRAGSARADLS